MDINENLIYPSREAVSVSLALLYVQKKNQENTTPEQLAEEFMKAQEKIEAYISGRRY